MALSNSQYNEIMRVYDDRRRDDFMKQQGRIRDAYEKLPRLKELDAEIGRISLSAAEKLIEGDHSDKDTLRDRIAVISAEKKSLLRAAGFAENYLDLQYQCSDCRDTGFVNGQKCHCFKAMQQKLLYRQSNIDKIVQVQNFEHFNPEIFDNIVPIDASTGKTNRQYMLEVRQYLTDWTRNFDKNHGNLLLMGSPGTGKTFLINCVARELIQSSHSVIYLTSTDLFESFSKASFQGDAVQQDLNEAILSCDLLVIDDLGTELNNSFTTSRLFYVINQRMVYGRSVIISTNLSLSRLRDSYSERVVSRFMSDYDIIPLYGKDQRVGI